MEIHVVFELGPRLRLIDRKRTADVIRRETHQRKIYPINIFIIINVTNFYRLLFVPPLSSYRVHARWTKNSIFNVNPGLRNCYPTFKKKEGGEKKKKNPHFLLPHGSQPSPPPSLSILCKLVVGRCYGNDDDAPEASFIPAVFRLFGPEP